MKILLDSKGSDPADTVIKRLKAMQPLDIPEGNVVVTLTAVLKLLSKLSYVMPLPVSQSAHEIESGSRRVRVSEVREGKRQRVQ